MKKCSVFITGGAGGIGLATAKLFVADGWRVGIGDVDPAALECVAAEVDVETSRHDVRDYSDWLRILDAFAASDELCTHAQGEPHE